MTLARYTLASFAAPLAALVAPVLLALSVLYGEPLTLADGRLDDAPARGAGIFILIGLPVFYLLGVAFYAAIGHVLARTRQMSLRRMLLFSCVASGPLMALLCGTFLIKWDSSLESVFIMSIVALATSGLATFGALAWWLIAMPKAHRTTAPSSVQPSAAARVKR